MANYRRRNVDYEPEFRCWMCNEPVAGGACNGPHEIGRLRGDALEDAIWRRGVIYSQIKVYSHGGRRGSKWPGQTSNR